MGPNDPPFRCPRSQYIDWPKFVIIQTIDLIGPIETKYSLRHTYNKIYIFILFVSGKDIYMHMNHDAGSWG